MATKKAKEETCPKCGYEVVLAEHTEEECLELQMQENDPDLPVADGRKQIYDESKMAADGVDKVVGVGEPVPSEGAIVSESGERIRKVVQTELYFPTHFTSLENKDEFNPKEYEGEDLVYKSVLTGKFTVLTPEMANNKPHFRGSYIFRGKIEDM
jgi:hypothetical protein